MSYVCCKRAEKNVGFYATKRVNVWLSCERAAALNSKGWTREQQQLMLCSQLFWGAITCSNATLRSNVISALAASG